MNILLESAIVKTYQKFSKLPLGSVTARGWLKDQLLRSKDGMGGHLDELEPDMIATPHINYSGFDHIPFIEGPLDPTWVAGWSGEISGTYWTGLVQLAFTLQDADLIAKATQWVEGVLQHQEPDGYLGSFAPTTDRMADYNPWASTWCYRALLAFHEATGRKDVLDAVYRGCLWFCTNWKDHKTDYAGSTIIEPMVITYAYTGDVRLIQFCEDWLAWLEDHSIWQNKVSQYLSDALPYASMHAVAYGENVKHPALVYCATGDERLLRASENGLQKALNRIVHATGGPSSSSEFLSPTGGANEVEYCNFSTYNHSYAWMALATGEAKWGDALERALFNGAQGSRKKDERAIAYFAAPNQLFSTRESSTYAEESDYAAYSPCYHVACCPTQSVRIIPEFIRSMVLTDAAQDLYLLCYGPAEVRSPKLAFTMDTLYPFRETITLKIHKADGASLWLRIPAWCKNPTVCVGGTTVRLLPDASGFARLDVALTAGDQVLITFPMEVTLSKIDDSAASSKFPMVIARGPLVYAIPIPVEWKKYPGRPITPLPEDWSWFEAFPAMDWRDPLVRQNSSWHKAIDAHLNPSQIRVVEHDPNGYVWEKPPVTLEVPLYKAPYAYMLHTPRPQEAWEVPLYVEGEAEYCTLVPHGCTNLRITYLPRADV